MRLFLSFYYDPMNLDDRDKAFLMEVLEFGTYEIVQAEVTATALLTYSNNPFLLAVKVSYFII